MKRVSVGVLAICLGLSGCGRADHDRDGAEGTAGDKTAEARPRPVTETGCLTARGDQFVLTDLERGEGEAATETFQLIGREEDLRAHIGKQVRVTGEAEAAKVAVVQESTPPADVAPRGTSGGNAPKVSAQTETRMEVRKLNVSSVQPTGGSCAAEATGGAAPGTRPRQ